MQSKDDKEQEKKLPNTWLKVGDLGRKQSGLCAVVLLYVLLIIITASHYYNYREQTIGNSYLPANQPIMKRDPVKQDEIKLKEYELHINLYQFYLNLGLSAISFFYLITGGTLVYFLTNYKHSPPKTIILRERESLKDSLCLVTDFPILRIALLLPILLSGVFGWAFIYGAKKWLEVISAIGGFRDDLGIEKVPDIQFLHQLLCVFGSIFFVVGLFLLPLLFVDLYKAPSDERLSTDSDPSPAGS